MFLKRFIHIALLLATIQPASEAKVFEIFGSGKKAGPANRFGWTLAYQSEMNLNGVEGVVHVYGIEKELLDVLEDLRSYYSMTGRTGEFFEGEPMAWGVGRDKKFAVRYFLQEGPSRATTLVYEIKQSLKEYLKTLDKPLQHQMDVIPPYPGSEPTYFMHDLGSDTALEVSSSSTSPEAVTDFYHHSLSTSGWRTRLGDAGSMRIFEKGRELAMISASEGADGVTRITRVHKKLGTKKPSK